MPAQVGQQPQAGPYGQYAGFAQVADAGVSVALGQLVGGPVAAAILAVIDAAGAITVALINRNLTENLARRVRFYQTYMAQRAVEQAARMSAAERVLWATIVPAGVGVAVLLLVGRTLVG